MKPPKTPPAKKPSRVAAAARAVSNFLWRADTRWMTLSLLAVGLLALGTWLLWKQVRERVLNLPEYQLDMSKIYLTSPPEWVHADVRREVIESASWQGKLSILDPELCPRVAKSFELHPWVAKVVRVSKQYPAEVLVEVEYRRPVCMVEVPEAPGEVPDLERPEDAPGDWRAAVRKGLYPIDETGVLLPTADFSQALVKRYPRLSGIQSLPLGPVGTPWGDPAVTGAAELAAFLLESWHDLQLHRIEPSERPILTGSLSAMSKDVEFGFELYTRSGTHILWGSRPGLAIEGEAPAAEKLERLKTALHGTQIAHGEDPPPPLEIDVRNQRGVTMAPRTARRDASSSPR